MKRKEFIKYLLNHGCVLQKTGRKRGQSKKMGKKVDNSTLIHYTLA
jgi:hypothetical protein